MCVCVTMTLSNPKNLLFILNVEVNCHISWIVKRMSVVKSCPMKCFCCHERRWKWQKRRQKINSKNLLKIIELISSHCSYAITFTGSLMKRNWAKKTYFGVQFANRQHSSIISIWRRLVFVIKIFVVIIDMMMIMMFVDGRV